jgi:hypothetical protein
MAMVATEWAAAACFVYVYKVCAAGLGFRMCCTKVYEAHPNFGCGRPNAVYGLGSTSNALLCGFCRNNACFADGSDESLVRVPSKQSLVGFSLSHSVIKLLCECYLCRLVMRVRSNGVVALLLSVCCWCSVQAAAPGAGGVISVGTDLELRQALLRVPQVGHNLFWCLLAG